MAGVVGIEPTSKVLETFVLPLNYTPLKMVEGDGFEPPNPEGADLQSAAFSHFATPPLEKTILIIYNIGDFVNNFFDKWCRPEDLNPQPTDYKSVALPIELDRQITNNHGGSGRNRTADTRIFSPLLYQLSY